MTRILFTLLLLCAFQQKNFAQNKDTDAQLASLPETNASSIDALASYIKQNFTSDTARIRAIYVWIAHHISYDVQRLLEREKNPEMQAQTVADVMKTRRAVCQGYSDLFIALCRSAGINAMVVTGYTKKEGRVSSIPHAWTAAELGGQWWLFDPTWSAGYVVQNRFTQRFNNNFYMVAPASLISDHMPFDPIYQFLSYPLTHKEFIDGKPPASKTLFNYRDSLRQHSQLSSVQQWTAELRRLEAGGIQNDLLRERQLFLKKAQQAYAAKDVFDESGKTFMSAVALFKEYIGYKNKQFTTIEDNDLRQMIDSMVQYVRFSRSMLAEAEPKNDSQRQAKAGNVANIERFWVQLSKEKDFTEQYFATDPAQRRQLFTRR